MGRQFKNYGILALILSVVVYFGLNWLTGWNRFLTGIVAMSIATFVLYGLDKLEAKTYGRNAKKRVPENLLHLLALLGGFPGGWAGMFIFWHKVRKPVFWVVLTFSTVLYLVLIIFTRG